MDIETLFRNVGMLLCVLASVHMLVTGRRRVGLLFLASFLLQFQSALYIEYVGHPEGTGECWATQGDYYQCLPLAFKVSIHAAQVSIYLMALAVFMAGRSIGRRAD